MKIVIAHNAYQQRGGEDAVVEDEIDLLRGAGHTVFEYRRHNDDIFDMRPSAVALQTLWSSRTLSEFSDVLDDVQPDVVHVHNTFPLISPTLHVACGRRRVPLVQTLHNFRLACASGTMLRDGQPCERCVGRLPWPALAHGCYRGSRVQTAVLLAGNALHATLGSVRSAVHRYIALSQYSRDKYVAMGLPADRLAIKPNFVADPALAVDAPRRGLLFAGRLSEEKGIAVLARALAQQSGIDLAVAGTGPLSHVLEGSTATVLGKLAPHAVTQAMSQRVAVVIPSTCYEGFPRTLVEAFATATPVIASRIGALAELVRHGETGLLVPPGDAAALGTAMRWATDNPQAMRQMGRRAREHYLSEFTPAHNLPRLLQIYAQASAEAGR